MKKYLVKLLALLVLTSFAFGEEIKIGVIQGLSGPIAFYGQTTLNGIKLAIDQINEQGGINGDKIKLIIEDNKGKAGESVVIAKKLINKDGVVAILGPTISTSCLAVAPIAQESKTPMLTATGTNTLITQAGDYVARICFIDPFQGEVMANFGSRNLNAKTAMILEDAGSDYSLGLSDSFKKRFLSNGGEVFGTEKYVATDVDFSAQLTKVKAKNPDVIFVPGYQEVALIVKQARELGIKSVFLGGDGWDSQDILNNAGDAINGSFVSTHFSAESQDPMIVDFLKAHIEKYGEEPSVLTALGYDAARVMVDAIKRAGSTDKEAIKNAINSTKDFKGVTGTITLDENRNPVKDAFVLEAKDGKFVYKATVAPAAESNIVEVEEKTENTKGNKNVMIGLIVLLGIVAVASFMNKKK